MYESTNHPKKFSRIDRLYVLASVCKQRGITPNDTRYMGTIIGVCAATFQLPKPKAKELAQILTSAYRQDRWENILQETTPIEQQTAPAIIAQQKDRTPKQDAMILKGLARRDTYDGVGRLIHKEIQLELGNLTPEEIIETWQTYNTKDTIEQNTTGNIYLIYWGGKQKLEDKRDLRPITWNPQRPILPATKEIYQEPKLETDNDLPKQNGVPDTIEDSDGVLEDMEDSSRG